MTLEDQIRALLEAKNNQEKEDRAADDQKGMDQTDSTPEQQDGQDQADRVDQEPAVKIENPLTPGLTSSEFETPESEIQNAEMQGVEDEKEEDEKENQKSVNESISDLLGDDFDDEFKLKASTIFEAAVKDQVIKIEAKLQEEHKAAVVKLQEEFDEKLAIRGKQLEEETSDKIDGYLGHLAESWKQDNKIALETAIKSELTESFISNLKAVFEQHYIDLPDDKVDLYQKTLEEKAEMEMALSTTVGNLARLQEELNKAKRANIIEEASKEFSSLDASRFKSLTEDFNFDDEDTFKNKLSIVKKSFFGNKTQSTGKEHLSEELKKATEIVETESHVETVVENTAMTQYLRALGKKK